MSGKTSGETDAETSTNTSVQGVLMDHGVDITSASQSGHPSGRGSKAERVVGLREGNTYYLSPETDSGRGAFITIHELTPRTDWGFDLRAGADGTPIAERNTVNQVSIDVTVAPATGDITAFMRGDYDAGSHEEAERFQGLSAAAVTPDERLEADGLEPESFTRLGDVPEEHTRRVLGDVPA